MQLGHAVHRFGQQFRCGMRASVKFLIHPSIIQPEVRGKINYGAARLNQWAGKLRRYPMRQGEENDFSRFFQRGGVGFTKNQR